MGNAKLLQSFTMLERYNFLIYDNIASLFGLIFFLIENAVSLLRVTFKTRFDVYLP